MPTNLTVFAARYLVFIAVVLAAAVLATRLWSWPRLRLLNWAVAACLVLTLSYAFAQLGGTLYTDPRPFTTSHIPPLIPHAPDNGFPSDHALLAAALVALVAMVDGWWAMPFVLLAVIVDWARVGAGLHHAADSAGSSAAVLLATLVALLVAPRITAWLSLRLPAQWAEERLVHRRVR